MVTGVVSDREFVARIREHVDASSAESIVFRRDACRRLARITGERFTVVIIDDEYDKVPRHDVVRLIALAETIVGVDGIGGVVPPVAICTASIPCPACGVHHGAEAEELRRRLEDVAADHPVVRKILDTVDARDCVAYLEYCKLAGRKT